METPPAPEVEVEGCGCYRCLKEMDDRSPLPDPGTGFSFGRTSRFIVCAICGNKRCPKATDHRLACSGSNAPGQEGSNYA